MKKPILIPNESDNSIQRIEYAYYDTCVLFDDEQFKLKLDSSQAAAYWWIKRIKEVVRFIAARKDEKEYDGYQSFLDAVGNFSELDYRKLYLRLVEMYRKRIAELPSDEYEWWCYNGTNQACHDEVNEVINGLLKDLHPDGKVVMPDVDLNTYSKQTILHVHKDKVDVEYVADGYSEKVQSSYSGEWEYLYVLSGDMIRVCFSNLIKKVIITLSEWGKLEELTLNRICQGFCVGYINEFDSDVDRKALAKEFMNAFWIFIANGFDIKLKDNFKGTYAGSTSDVGFKLLEYYPNPTDNNGLDSYKEIAERIATVICAKKIDRKRMCKAIENR